MRFMCGCLRLRHGESVNKITYIPIPAKITLNQVYIDVASIQTTPPPDLRETEDPEMHSPGARSMHITS